MLCGFLNKIFTYYVFLWVVGSLERVQLDHYQDYNMPMMPG